VAAITELTDCGTRFAVMMISCVASDWVKPETGYNKKFTASREMGKDFMVLSSMKLIFMRERRKLWFSC